jgi:hypothetical protein
LYFSIAQSLAAANWRGTLFWLLTRRSMRQRLAAVVGGHDGTKALATVDGFDAATSQWRALPPLATARRDAAVAALADGRLLVCSGTDGEAWLRSCELYDPDAHAWSEVAAMPSARATRACLLGDGRIAVIGGWTDEVVEFHRREPCVDTRSRALSSERGVEAGAGGDGDEDLSAWPSSNHRWRFGDLRLRLEREKDDPDGLDATISDLEGVLRELVQGRRWLPKEKSDGGDGMSLTLELAEECLLSELRLINTHNGKADDRWYAPSDASLPLSSSVGSTRSEHITD